MGFILFNKNAREDKQEQTTLGVRTSSIGKRIPLLIPNFAHYYSIVRAMNVFWALILAS
jgi:hypothetical protein